MSYGPVTLAAMLIDYAVRGPLTGLDGVPAEALGTVAADPVSICSPVHALIVQPTDPGAVGLPEQRLAENQIRPAGELLARLLALDPAPLSLSRDPDKRVVGTCRHCAVLSCALLRYRGYRCTGSLRNRDLFPARSRPGPLDHRVSRRRCRPLGPYRLRGPWPGDS